jgi:hypothetical protein
MTPQEQSFVARRQALFTRITECVITVELCYDLRSNYHGRVDWLSGERTFATPLNQQFIESWTYKTTSREVTLDVVLGHTGPNWQVFITVTTTDGFSERFLDDGQTFPVRPVLIREIKRINNVA